MVAMVAKENRVPVVAVCETYKFGERVVLDGVTGNELGDWGGRGGGEGVVGGVMPIHLLYDLTPPTLVTAVCTEVSVGSFYVAGVSENADHLLDR